MCVMCQVSGPSGGLAGGRETKGEWRDEGTEGRIKLGRAPHILMLISPFAYVPAFSPTANSGPSSSTMAFFIVSGQPLLVY